MLTWDRTGPLGESGGSSVVKDRVSDMQSCHFQGCIPHMCWLRTDRLAPMSKYWTYWSHAEDMRPVSWCSIFINRRLTWAYCLNDCEGREIEWGSMVRQCVMDWDESPFSWEQYDPFKFIGSVWKVAICRLCEIRMGKCHTRTEHGMFVARWSGFCYRVYIDLNRRDSRIWVTVYLVFISMKLT
jgi:hypothetical protein